jgi:hypothetical protein
MLDIQFTRISSRKADMLRHHLPACRVLYRPLAEAQ